MKHRCVNSVERLARYRLCWLRICSTLVGTRLNTRPYSLTLSRCIFRYRNRRLTLPLRVLISYLMCGGVINGLLRLVRCRVIAWYVNDRTSATGRLTTLRKRLVYTWAWRLLLLVSKIRLLDMKISKFRRCITLMLFLRSRTTLAIMCILINLKLLLCLRVNGRSTRCLPCRVDGSLKFTRTRVINVGRCNMFRKAHCPLTQLH